MAHLSAGFPAPDFLATTFDGKKVRLSDLQGKFVWLIFYRYPGCPLCNLHMSALRKRYESYQKAGLQIVAVFESTADKFDPKAALNFPMIADPGKELYRLYGAEVRNSAAFQPSVGAKLMKAIFAGHRQGKIEGQIGQIPAHFLIGEGGEIEVAYYGNNIADHLGWPVIEKFITSHQEGFWQPNTIV